MVVPEMGLALLVAVLLVLALLPVDARLAAAMREEPAGVLAFFGIATDAGLSAWYVYPAAALLILLSLGDWREATRIGRRRVASLHAHAGFLLASVGGAALLVQALKALFGRSRPELLDADGALSFTPFAFAHLQASFPSGHSATMGAATMTLALWFPQLRLPAVVAGVSLALSRLVVGAHFASDIVMGFTLGALAALAAARFLARRRVLFGFVSGGRGWRGLLPVRLEGWRDVGLEAAARRVRLSRRR